MLSNIFNFWTGNRSSGPASSGPQLFQTDQTVYRIHSYLNEIAHQNGCRDVGYLMKTIDTIKPSTNNMAAFILLTGFMTNTGRFSILWKMKLRDMLAQQNTSELQRFLTMDSDILLNEFVELYDNPYLTQTEYDTVDAMVTREFQAVQNLLQNGKHKYNLTNQNYQVCYDRICVSEDSAEFSVGLSLPEVVRFVDHGIACKLGYLDLVNELVKVMPINECTGRPFSPEVLKALQERYHKEIAMLTRTIVGKTNGIEIV